MQGEAVAAQHHRHPVPSDHRAIAPCATDPVPHSAHAARASSAPRSSRRGRVWNRHGGSTSTRPRTPKRPHDVRASASAPRSTSVHALGFVRYTHPVPIEAVLQQVLRMPVEERAELVERLIDSLDEIEVSAEELAHLDEAIADADRAVERGELIPAGDVLAQMRQIS